MYHSNHSSIEILKDYLLEGWSAIAGTELVASGHGCFIDVVLISRSGVFLWLYRRSTISLKSNS